ncbi:hypothetical protein M8J76_010998 [Diaphorina citri]|nr:hypothetical protein M8J76_010998 [Diaphorina citri]
MPSYREYLCIVFLSLVSLHQSLPVTYNFTLEDFLNINNWGGGAPAATGRNSRVAKNVNNSHLADPAQKAQVNPQLYSEVPSSGKDLELSESGYIFRSDDHSPPMLIKLGVADDNKFNDMLKKAGISMPEDGITYSSPSYDNKNSYKDHKIDLPAPLPRGFEGDHPAGFEDAKDVKSYTPTSSPNQDYNQDFKLNPVALAPQLDDSEEDASPLRSHGNTDKPEDEITYTYTQEPIRFEYVSHSADDDGFEELLKKLHEDNNDGSDDTPGGHLEEVYKPPKSSGKPLYESGRTFEGFDQGSPSIDLKLDTKSGLSKSFIAPIFELPSSYDSSFDRHTAPVKYTLKKKPKYTAPVLADPHHEDDHDHDHIPDHGEDHHGFDKGGGGSYDSEHHNEHGHSHDKGYKDYNEYDTKEKSKYGKEEDKGFYNGKDGHKKHHYNEGDKYGEHHNKKKGVKGSKYGSSGYHKKGHKTNGYHNIFHKDEFKKEHKFYDDAKKEGFFDKYGNYHRKHGTKGGGKHDTGFHESGYDAAHQGKDGLYDKGFATQAHKGHDSKSGHSSGFSDFEDLDKKFGHDEEKKYGYSDALEKKY